MKKLLWVPVLLGALVLALLTPRFRRDIQEGSLASIRKTVLRAAAQCYAVEGVYPPSLSYLEENYHLVLNHRDFIVSYEAFSSNQPPQVRVLVRGEG